MYKTLLVLALVSYVAAQSVQKTNTTINKTTITTVNTTEDWNCCAGSNNHIVVTRGECSESRRLQMMMQWQYCVKNNNSRRLQSMVPQCQTMGARRLHKMTRRNQMVVKLCPVDADGFQCAKNPTPSSPCGVNNWTVNN